MFIYLFKLFSSFIVNTNLPPCDSCAVAGAAEDVGHLTSAHCHKISINAANFSSALIFYTLPSWTLLQPVHPQPACQHVFLLFLLILSPITQTFSLRRPYGFLAVLAEWRLCAGPLFAVMFVPLHAGPVLHGNLCGTCGSSRTCALPI